MKYIFIINLLAFFSIDSFAGFETEKIETFQEVVNFTLNIVNEADKESLLVVFDIDRTVLETVDCLDPSQEFSNGFFKFEAKVRQCHGELTSPLVPDFINELKKQKIAVMALTARRSQILEATLSQLEERLWVTQEGEEEALITFETSPLYTNRKKTVKFDQPGKNKILKKELVIKRGVATASGADKGLGLQAYLKRAESAGFGYNRIVFIDDDRRNIRNLEDAFSDTEEFISIVHYTEHIK